MGQSLRTIVQDSQTSLTLKPLSERIHARQSSLLMGCWSQHTPGVGLRPSFPWDTTGDRHSWTRPYCPQHSSRSLLGLSTADLEINQGDS